jgi:hypothetical protein
MTTRDEIMAMDEDALRLAVAKACGLTGIYIDPLTIAAAYALEDALPEEKHAQYAIYLYDIILRKGVWWDWSMIHASAADRCRAWLMTMEA